MTFGFDCTTGTLVGFRTEICAWLGEAMTGFTVTIGLGAGAEYTGLAAGGGM